MNDNNPIDAEFTEIVPVDEKQDNLPQVYEKDDVELEFEYARANIIKILETSNEVLDNTAELALDSDHPKMIDSYSTLIKNLVDINKSLFEIRERKQRIRGEVSPQDEGNITKTVNNAIFVGSTEELAKMLGKK